MKKKLLCALIATVMCIGYVPDVSIYAAECDHHTEHTEGFCYTQEAVDATTEGQFTVELCEYNCGSCSMGKAFTLEPDESITFDKGTDWEVTYENTGETTFDLLYDEVVTVDGDDAGLKVTAPGFLTDIFNGYDFADGETTDEKYMAEFFVSGEQVSVVDGAIELNSADSYKIVWVNGVRLEALYTVISFNDDGSASLSFLSNGILAPGLACTNGAEITIDSDGNFLLDEGYIYNYLSSGPSVDVYVNGKKHTLDPSNNESEYISYNIWDNEVDGKIHITPGDGTKYSYLNTYIDSETNYEIGIVTDTGKLDISANHSYCFSFSDDVTFTDGDEEVIIPSGTLFWPNNDEAVLTFIKTADGITVSCDQNINATDDSVQFGDLLATFDMMNHGEAIEPVNIGEDGKISRPADPVDEYYDFAGWYTYYTYEYKWDFENDTTTWPTTLYAKWELKEGVYDINVADKMVTAENADDVLGDGTVSYDALTNILTLDGFKYEGSGHTYMLDGYTNSSVIRSHADELIIELKGENSITLTDPEDDSISSVAVFLHSVDEDAAFSIEGDGSLDIESGACAIDVNADKFTVKNTDIRMDAYFGIYMTGNLFIENSNLDLTADEGIYVGQRPESGDEAGLDITDSTILSDNTSYVMFIMPYNTANITDSVIIASSRYNGLGGNYDINGDKTFIYVSMKEYIYSVFTEDYEVNLKSGISCIIPEDEYLFNSPEVLLDGNYHIFSEEYTTTSTHHYHACTDENCPLMDYTHLLEHYDEADYGKHDTDGKDGTCSVCGAVYVPTGVYVGTVGLSNGEYLDNNGKISKTKPDGGYAYYNKGRLTLYNYKYLGYAELDKTNDNFTPDYEYDDSDIAAGIFSENDLEIVLKGENYLDIYEGEGITTFGDLLISGNGSLMIYTYGDCIDARGDLTLESGKVYLYSEDDDGLIAKGKVYIKGGDLEIESYNECITGYCGVNISGGNMDLVSNDEEGIITYTRADHESNYLFGGGDIIISGGNIEIESEEEGIYTERTTFMSAEGEEYASYGGGNITVSGGDITIKCESDGIEAIYGGYGQGNVTITGGNLNITCEASGFEADNLLAIKGGNIVISADTDATGAAALHSENGTIEISGGYIEAEVPADTGEEQLGFLGAIKAEYGISLVKGMTITSPEGAKIVEINNEYFVADKDGNLTAKVIIQQTSEGGECPSSSASSGGTSAVMTSAKADNEKVTVTTSNSSLSSSVADKAVKDAADKGLKNIVVSTTAEKITLPEGFVEDVADEAGASLTVVTDGYQVTFPEDVLNDMDAEGKVTVAVSEKEISITDKNGKLEDIGEIKVTVRSAKNERAAVTVTYPDGTTEVIKIKADKKGNITFPVKGSAKYSIAKDEDAYHIVLTIGEKNAYVFGNKVTNDVAPIIRNERTMLPIRFIAEALGAQVFWNADEQKVIIIKGSDVIEIAIGKAEAMVNGVAVALDSPAFIENSRTYLPVRFIAENLDAEVLWDETTKEVTIIPE